MKEQVIFTNIYRASKKNTPLEPLIVIIKVFFGDALYLKSIGPLLLIVYILLVKCALYMIQIYDN